MKFNKIINEISKYKKIGIVEEHLEDTGLGSEISRLIFKKK